MYEVAICDDSAIDRELLKETINKCKKYMHQLRFHEYSSGKELLEGMKDMKISLIFLDIQMEEIDGEQVAEEIRKWDDSVVLVFYTGYAEPNPHSIELQPYRYIKKNMPEEEKYRYIEDALRKMEAVAEVPVFLAKMNGCRLILKPNDIVYIEKSKRFVSVHLSNAARIRHHIPVGEEKEPKIKIMDKLENLYEQLKPYGFGYPHDSYIINFKYMMSCTEREIRLDEYPGIVFNVTRSKAVAFNRLKKEFLTAKYGG